MKYAYEELGEDQFEQLVVLLCYQLLGASVQGFAKGPDGGRDALFHGVAQRIPSTVAPWKGITVIQAKHTFGVNCHFSDKDFFSEQNKSSTLLKEIPKIKKLREENKLDHYMIFSNRILTANANDKIRSYISGECNISIDSIMLCGIEQIEMWMKQFPDVAKQASIDPVDSPLYVSPDLLAEIVESLADAIEDNVSQKGRRNSKIIRTSFVDKNILNQMTQEYADELAKRYLKEMDYVEKFFSNPENNFYLKKYEDVVEEFQLNIIAKRKSYQSFDEVMNYLIKVLLKRDPILYRHKKLTKVLLFYMYWSCDIGRSRT